MSASRASRRVRFGFSWTAVYSVSPSSAKQMGTTRGEPSGRIVASRATGSDSGRGKAGANEDLRPPELARVHRRVERLGERRGPEGGRHTLLIRVAVERRTLARYAPGGADHRFHPLGRHLLAERGARRPRDRLVHERPAEVVHTRAQRRLHAV